MSAGRTRDVGGSDAGGVIAVWNGRAWRQVSSPDPGAGAFLNGVAAVSARSAWPVGYGANYTPVILDRNGRAWQRMPVPAPAQLGIAGRASATASPAETGVLLICAARHQDDGVHGR